MCQVAINERQRWFLAEVGRRRMVRPVDIMRRWAISEKTAKHDISALKAARLITFTGTLR
jgi:DeoR/GlpR family transcriptional regulator of sugar metabolism